MSGFGAPSALRRTTFRRRIVVVPFLGHSSALGEVAVDHLQDFLQCFDGGAAVAYVVAPTEVLDEHPLRDALCQARLQLHHQQRTVRGDLSVDALEIMTVQRMPTVVDRRARRYVGIMASP